MQLPLHTTSFELGPTTGEPKEPQQPKLGNGFAFVTDYNHQSDYITLLDFVSYLSQDQVPIAAPGHVLNEHDEKHKPYYEKMFALPEFAALVKDVSTRSLQHPTDKLALAFMQDFDGLGDCMVLLNDPKILLERGDWYLAIARGKLQTLVGLHIDNELPALESTAARDTLYASLWNDLGFKTLQNSYERAIRKPTRISRVLARLRR